MMSTPHAAVESVTTQHMQLTSSEFLTMTIIIKTESE